MRGDLVVWTADLPNHQQSRAQFNAGEAPLVANRSLKEFGLLDGHWTIRDAWTGELSETARGPLA